VVSLLVEDVRTCTSILCFDFFWFQRHHAVSLGIMYAKWQVDEFSITVFEQAGSCSNTILGCFGYTRVCLWVFSFNLWRRYSEL